MSPPIAAIRQNQASARMYAVLSALTSWASPCPTSCSSARGATVAQTSPAATPSTAEPARAAAHAVSRPFTARSYPSAPLGFDGVYVRQDRGVRVEAGLVPGALGRDRGVADAGFGLLAEHAELAGEVVAELRRAWLPPDMNYGSRMGARQRTLGL